MMPPMDPKKIEQMLKQLGMKMENIPARKVVIEADTGNIVVENPKVIKTTMQGQVVFQVSGNIKGGAFSEDDIKLVMEQSGVKDKEKVVKALEETNGDIVNAIMKLKK